MGFFFERLAAIIFAAAFGVGARVNLGVMGQLRYRVARKIVVSVSAMHEEVTTFDRVPGQFLFLRLWA